MATPAEEAESLKARALRAAGRASLCVQRETFPYAYVTVEGPVAFVDATGAPADSTVALTAAAVPYGCAAGATTSTEVGLGATETA